ncbi:MAG: EF-hand domain-containing protein [Deltaproteobacteria bacterium]|jgi:Ca2+-binding EF-hand superfamily protein|nr:EF-hand domain-containing protein [Deltaproteobacteria bacterium]
MSISALSSADSSYWEEILRASATTKEAKKTENSSSLAETLFSNLDADGSEGISLEESGLDQETYDALDTDKDGSVSLAELENALELQRSALLTRTKIAGGEEQALPFSESDEDGSGGASQAGAESSQSVFDSMDTNQDGVVSAEELAAALAQQQFQSGGSESSGVDTARKSKDFLSSLASRAYNSLMEAMQRTKTDQALDLSA